MAAIALDDKGPANNAYIDALLCTGWRWSGTINYFFDHDTSIWTAAEKNAFRGALQSWANVANFNFQEVFVEAEANFVEHSVPDSMLPGEAGVHGTPDDTFNNQIEGEFNYGAYSIQETHDPVYDESGLVRGGYGFETFIHELGHGLGLTHPHTRESGSGLFPGVTEDDANDEGDNNLCQTVYSVMSYNEYRQVANDSSYGYAGGPSAFDIAAIQHLYGIRSFNTGSDTYWLPDSDGAGTFWTCIWDTAGTDQIAYGGTANATIDLRAATIDNTPGGGGMISSVLNMATGVRYHGGFTIARGVNIENASGGSGSDKITGNDSSNVLNGNDGDDTLTGLGNVDYLRGGWGADVLNGGTGFGIFGNADEALYDLSVGSVEVDLLNPAMNTGEAFGDTYYGIEDVTGSRWEDYIAGDNGANILHGDPTSGNSGSGHDWLLGRGGSDALGGVFGNDILDGGVGADDLSGGPGTDTATYASATTGVTVDMAFPQVNEGDADGDSYNSIENLTGSRFEDNLLGSDSANVIMGGAGVDLLDGRFGRDTLDGGADDDSYFLDDITNIPDPMYDFVIEAESGGFDTIFIVPNSPGFYFLPQFVERGIINGDGAFDLYGHNVKNFLEGNDQANEMWAFEGDDVIQSFAGNDTLNGGNGNDTLDAGAGADSIVGGAGVDMASYGASFESVFVFLAAQHLNNGGDAGGDTLSSIESLYGSHFGDLLSGDANPNLMVGVEGDDYLAGAGGRDTLKGGIGNDVLASGAGADRMIGAGGFDSATYELSPAGVTADLRNFGANTGEAAGDTYVVVENLLGSGLGDTLRGTDGDNVIDGWAGGDRILGRGGRDTLTGAQGNDTLTGDANADLLTGGIGTDRFDFNAVAESPARAGRDTITDFSSGHGDRIDLASIDADTGVAGDQEFALILSGFTGVAGQLRSVVSGGHRIVQADTNGDGQADFHIVVQNVASLAAADFVL